jgi:hypothetical protein
MSGVGSAGAVTILHWPANAAEFTYKFGASSPMEHPAMARTKIAADKIRQASNGRLDISIFPNSQLGGDTAMISQVISGAMQMYLLPIDLLAPRKPVCGITGTGFAFSKYDAVWAAMDGDLGKLLRSAQPTSASTASKPATITASARSRRNLRRSMARTTCGASDPVASGTIFPCALPASRRGSDLDEFQRGLQCPSDRSCRRDRRTLVLIDTAKLYEVQKYCSLTNHVWSGFHVGFNVNAWKKLPARSAGPGDGYFHGRGPRPAGLPQDDPGRAKTLTARYGIHLDIKPFAMFLQE